MSAELSVGHHGYAGQTLRTMILDDTPNALYARLHETAEAAYRGMCEALEPGATTDDVLDAAEVIDRAGFEIIDGLLHGYSVGILPPPVPGESYPTGLSRPVRMRGRAAGRSRSRRT
ncbi:MAG: M24 family metallopeptidase [Streptosporangiales bacterium]|nr:M24 family metallopeptidase [Streptosporangiales bacterium]MBO0891051.1 M24 family metallopeptidase [Acidothermales bacterium]